MICKYIFFFNRKHSCLLAVGNVIMSVMIFFYTLSGIDNLGKVLIINDLAHVSGHYCRRYQKTRVRVLPLLENEGACVAVTRQLFR